MRVSSSGGGYFYGPFTSTQMLGTFTAIPDPVVGVYGAWVHGLPLILTGKSRWIMLIAAPPQGSPPDTNFAFQVGIGAAGSETQFQPTTGARGFPAFWGNADKWIYPIQYSFPCSIPRNSDLSIRCLQGAGAGSNLEVQIILWN